MMEIDFLAAAGIELSDAVSYYNTQSGGLGFDFALEVKKTIERIIQYPEAWAMLSKRTRCCRTNRFPYGIIYQVRAEKLLIVAIMHHSRDPQSWKSRLKDEEL